MSRSLRATAAVLAGVVLTSSVAHAQNSAAIAQRPNVIEIGADAGLTFGLGDKSYVNFDFPAQSARLGFFLNNDSRVSIEPALGVSTFKAKDTPASTDYIAQVGALYHFQPARLVTDVTNRQTVSYVRPFVGLSGSITGGDAEDDHSVFAGAGIGVKVPYRTNIAFRAEANVGYDFDNEAARIGLNLGLSFFTSRNR